MSINETKREERSAGKGFEIFEKNDTAAEAASDEKLAENIRLQNVFMEGFLGEYRFFRANNTL